MGEPDKKHSIMVVDDEKQIRDLLERLLSISGYEVLTAHNGLKLLSILKVNQPDLIILDIMMSWIDGFELCRIIKKTEQYQHIPVIFLSGRNAKEDIKHGYDVGCVDYITKPFDTGDLIKRIQAVLE